MPTQAGNLVVAFLATTTLKTHNNNYIQNTSRVFEARFSFLGLVLLWLRLLPPSEQSTAMQNFIAEYRKTLSINFCQQLINKFEQTPDKVTGRTGAGTTDERTTQDLYISTLRSWSKENQIIAKLILNALVQYTREYPFVLIGALHPTIRDPDTGDVRPINRQDIAAMNSNEIRNLLQQIFQMDDMRIQRYDRGDRGTPEWHSEHFPHPTDQRQNSLHRVLFWQIFLNDVADGGETEFFFQRLFVKPKTGCLLMAPSGFTHTHRNLSPETGDQYLINSWVLYKQADKLYQRT